MSNPPGKRFKNPEDFSVAEHVAAQSARRRGEVFRVETDAYVQHRADALCAAGLDDEADEAQKPADELSAQEHVERLRIKTPRFGN